MVTGLFVNCDWIWMALFGGGTLVALGSLPETKVSRN
jgi:hypothetical protein